MPPDDRPQPSRDEVGLLTQWIKSAALGRGLRPDV